MHDGVDLPPIIRISAQSIYLGLFCDTLPLEKWKPGGKNGRKAICQIARCGGMATLRMDLI
jgi:hypothetical protein